MKTTIEVIEERLYWLEEQYLAIKNNLALTNSPTFREQYIREKSLLEGEYKGLHFALKVINSRRFKDLD